MTPSDTEGNVGASQLGQRPHSSPRHERPLRPAPPRIWIFLLLYYSLTQFVTGLMAATETVQFLKLLAAALAVVQLALCAAFPKVSVLNEEELSDAPEPTDSSAVDASRWHRQGRSNVIVLIGVYLQELWVAVNWLLSFKLTWGVGAVLALTPVGFIPELFKAIF